MNKIHLSNLQHFFMYLFRFLLVFFRSFDYFFVNFASFLNILIRRIQQSKMEVVWKQMHNFYVTLRHYFPFWTSMVTSLNSLFYHLSVIAIALILSELWVGGTMVDPRWLPFSNYDLTNTLYSVISSRYKPQRKPLWVYYLSSQLVVKYCLSVIQGGVVSPSSRPLPGDRRRTNARPR